MFDGGAWRHWTHSDGLGAENLGNQPASANTGLGTRSRHDLSVLLQGRETYNPAYVFAIHVDDDDRVWAGTWGGGVSLYENGAWSNLTTADGLAGNIVYSIAEDVNALWFGTNRGLSRFDGRNWVTFDMEDGLLGNDVYAIKVGNDNDVWVGTKRGVARLSYDTTTTTPEGQ